MSICDVPVIAEVCNLGGDVAGVMVAAPFEWLASAVGHAAAMMFENVWAVFDTTTLVDLTSEQYIAVYNIVFGIAIVVMLVFFFLQLGTGLIRRDAGALQRAVLGLAKSVLGSFLVVTSTATLLEIVDQLCIGIVEPTGTTMEQMGDRIAALALGLTAITFATPGVGAIIVLILGGMAVLGAATVWGTLLIRKTLLLVAIVIAPLAFSAASWDAVLREKLAVLEGKITNLVAAIEGANAAPEVLLQQLSTRTHEGDMLRGELTRLTARQAIAADEVEELIGLRRRAGVRTQRRDRRGEGRSLPGT